MSRSAAATACTVLAVLVIIAIDGAPGAAAVHCDVRDLLGVCSGPIKEGSPPDVPCCKEIEAQEQLLCLCDKPGYEGYLKNKNVLKTLSSCHLPPPDCEP